MSNIKEQIRQEIERQRSLIEGLFIEGDNSFYEGQDNAYNHLLAFIDSLPEEKSSEDLEEEVKRYYSDNFTYISSDQPTLSILTNVARHFAEWGAKHLK